MKLGLRILFALAFTFTVGVRARTQDIPRTQFHADLGSHAPASSLIAVDSETPVWGLHPKVTHYATGFDGDHSLEEATVVEQTFAQYSLYTVRLQFASGARQSLVLTAPPGGLQPQMRDMSGDSIPNDLVLTPKLLRLPLIVLLNEGHDHLTVAISPGSFTNGQGRASGPHQVHRPSVLLSSGFKLRGLLNYAGPRCPQPEENLLSTLAPLTSEYAQHQSSSGRAPPALIARI